MLSERDVASVADVSRTLLSALDSPNVDAWYRRLESDMSAALGADMFAASMPAGGRERMYTSHDARLAFDAYMHQSLPALEQQWGIRRRLLHLGVSNRRTLYEHRLPYYYRSMTWHEVIVPGRCFDTLAMAGSIGAGREAFLFVLHGTPTGRKFGRSGLAKFRLLYPSFMSGVRALQHVSSVDGRLPAVIDAVPSAIALGDDEGRLLHMNAPLRELLAAEGDSLALLAAVQKALARVALFSREPSRRRVTPNAHDGGARLTLGDSQFCFGGTRLGGSNCGTGATTLVTVDRIGPPRFPSEALRAHGMTSRETQILQLLTAGLTTVDVAEQLRISRYTARHHVESIMRKLDVHSRSALVAAVARLAYDGRSS